MVKNDSLFSRAKGAGLYIPKIITMILVEKSISNGYRQRDLTGIVFNLCDKFFPHTMYLIFSKLLPPRALSVA